MTDYHDTFVASVIRRILWTRPRLYRPVGLHRRRIDVADMNLDFHVDGFPRSANTYTAFFLRHSQAERFRVRSHHHVPPSIISSVRHCKPVFFVLRHPRESALSYAVLQRGGLAAQLRYYRDFHRALHQYRSQLFVALFEDIVANLPALVRRFDQRFDIGLSHDYDREAVERRVQEAIRRSAGMPDGTLNIRFYNLPLKEREPLKAQMRTELNRLADSPIFRQAEQEFSLFAGAACRPQQKKASAPIVPAAQPVCG
jgi:hypothetical protein